MIIELASSAPKAGSILKLTKKIRISISPSQKLGMAVPRVAAVVAVISSQLLRLSAEITPRGMAMSSPIAAETPASR